MKKHAAPIFAVIILLLPMLYVGGYLALVVPEGTIATKWQGPGPQPIDQYFIDDGWEFYLVHYRLADKIARGVFWPLEQIDRKLRPMDWHPSLSRKPLVRTI
ncbi:hypothetical protein ETAA8_06160 [Anatilimnocola aggregata]|uniref:Uncharacterized protein n=1 Tax=Anatilimnocola aggregata TaxID=2528021 RepID=A0A517Y5N0_9BACT|nr:hypothetical protein [Anatilimnocola aggregata]QDU25547.1 hypothetical protein ETAA8_06160 [Anatilimnocola aggregata]